MSHCATSTSSSSSSSSSVLRQAVLAGPQGLLCDEGGQDAGGGLGEVLLASGAFGAVDAGMLSAACRQGGYQEVCRRVLTGPVTVMAVVGMCLFAGTGYAGVLRRMWPALQGVWPPLAHLAPVTAQAFSTARTRVGAGPVRAVFTAHAARAWERIRGRCRPGGSGLLFALVPVACDGTVVDAAATPQMQAVYPCPAGGLYPQIRLLTLVHTASRRIIAATADAISVSEQVLWDRLVAAGHLTTGMLILCDRNFFSFARWSAAAATGADLAWRVKNGQASLPARLISTLADGSHLVALHEPQAAWARRRKASGDKRAPRAEPVLARLVEFTVTSHDDRGKTTTSRFRVLTTLLDPQVAPAQEVAAAYAHRWAIEVTYKILKTTLRGGPVRLRAQNPQTAEQELWALLTAYNILIDHAEHVADDLDLDITEVSITVILHAVRDHLAAGTCEHCGLPPSLQRLLAAIIAGPTVDLTRTRTAARGTPTQRRAAGTRTVTHTITIEPTDLLPAQTHK